MKIKATSSGWSGFVNDYFLQWIGWAIAWHYTWVKGSSGQKKNHLTLIRIRRGSLRKPGPVLPVTGDEL